MKNHLWMGRINLIGGLGILIGLRIRSFNTRPYLEFRKIERVFPTIFLKR